MKDRKNVALFTLVELLVVIAIIAILASMLLPALARARYKARLLTCATTMKGTADMVMLYASDNDRRYPERTIKTTGTPARHALKTGNKDDRQQYERYVAIDDVFNCAFAKPRSSLAESTADGIKSSYELYWGMPIRDGVSTEFMKRIGQLNVHDGNTFDILAADLDQRKLDTSRISAHPDHGGVLSFQDKSDNTTWCAVRYKSSNGVHVRGKMDRNFARVDGSVFSLMSLDDVDGRLVEVSLYHSGQDNRKAFIPAQ